MRLMNKNDFLDLFYVASAGQDKRFVNAVEMVVEDTPTIEAVPVRHGRWEHKSSAYDEHIYICKGKDGCGKQISILGNLLSYCPNCGAKMDGGAE